MNPEQPAQQLTQHDDAGIDVDEYLSEDLPTDFSEQAAGTSLAEEQSQTQSGTAPAPASDQPVAAASPLLGPGSVLRDRFVLQAQTGGGNMGQVYKALDRRRQEAGDPEPWVAVKLVQPAPGQHPQAREALHQEAQIGQRLTHPNIVRIFDVDREGDCSFLVMEWLDGESLAGFLDGRRWRPLPRLQALQIVEGICRALAYAHGQGIVHADIKPGNILLSADGNSKLLDFGVAQLIDTETAEAIPALVRGHTPEYASPEVIEGQVPAAADDLFSLACVAYRMLAGRRAFGKLNALEAEAAGQRPARIEHLPPSQWQALDGALAFRRADRPTDVNGFIASLKGPREEAAATASERIAELPAEATAEELVLEIERAESSGRRNRLRWAMAAAAIVAVAVLLSVTTRQPALTPAPAPVASAPVAPAALPVPDWELETLRQPPPPLPGPPADDPATASAPASAMAASTMPRSGAGPDAAGALPELPDVRAPDTVSLAGAGDLPGPDPIGLPAPPPAELAVLEAPPPRPPEAVPATGPPQVTMAELRFRRYVEPRFFREGLPVVSGWVDVGFTVDTAGRTADITVLGAEPGGYWADAAIEAVRRWRFQPVAQAGEVISVRSEVRLRFTPDLEAPAAQQAAN